MLEIRASYQTGLTDRLINLDWLKEAHFNMSLWRTIMLIQLIIHMIVSDLIVILKRRKLREESLRFQIMVFRFRMMKVRWIIRSIITKIAKKFSSKALMFWLILLKSSRIFQGINNTTIRTKVWAVAAPACLHTKSLFLRATSTTQTLVMLLKGLLHWAYIAFHSKV